MEFLPAEIIKKKRGGGELSRDEIRFMIDGYVSGRVPDYQVSALLMAIFFQGMTAAETATLTEIMLKSGRVLDFTHLPGTPVDKHSTGGVGDKTSLILAPIVAAAGVRVPMISGRGLGHTGGTLDKLESIPGFRVNLSLDEFEKQVESLGCALIGQTEEICPADKRIYALRDVTGTVESIPLICASIMSKKLAEGIGALVLDVKCGSGAFMKTLKDAELLTDTLMSIGTAHKKRVAALITNMDQPLGRFIGNALEMEECFAILKGESCRGRSDFDDCLDLSVELAGYMIWLGGKAKDAEEGIKEAKKILQSGKAWEMFERICVAQGGNLKQLPQAKAQFDVIAEADGFISGFNTEKIGIAALSLGAGRAKASDVIDHTAGIEVHRKIGDEVRRGDRLFTLYSSHVESDRLFANAKEQILASVTISLQKPPVPDLIIKRKVN